MEREEILEEIKRLAGGRVNDAVRLAYLSEEELREIEGLELSAVTEFKRSSNGTVELKFIDRLSALQWLSEQAEDPKGERLYEALEKGIELQQDRGRGETVGTVPPDFPSPARQDRGTVPTVLAPYKTEGLSPLSWPLTKESAPADSREDCLPGAPADSREDCLPGATADSRDGSSVLRQRPPADRKNRPSVLRASGQTPCPPVCPGGGLNGVF